MHIATLLSTLALAAAWMIAPSPAEASRGCGWIIEYGGMYDVRIERGHLRCATARSTIRSYFRSTNRCSGSACVLNIGRWTCASTYSDFPRAATCRRAGVRLSAYAVGE